MRPIRRWGLQWRERSRLDGYREHIVCENCMPALFHTREQARAYAKQHYGYIAERPDLQAEPHGWKMPRPIKLTIGVGG